MNKLFRIFIFILFFLGCRHQTNNAKFDFEIKSPEDNIKLKKLEKNLTVTPEKAALNPDYQILEQISVPYVPEYKIGPGDVIEIVYQIQYNKTSENYRIDVQDKLSITFPFHPQFSSTVIVRTDGKITVPLIGDAEVESKTPEEVAIYLNKEYRKYLVNPLITVAIEEFNVKVEEMKKVITTAPRGQSKIAPVKLDGRISFPIIGEIQAEGFTLAQLEKTVNERYGKFIKSINSTLILLEIHHPKCYVIGEVNKPGIYEMTSRINILDAIAIAGSFTNKAYLDEVVIFRNDGLERPIAFKVNVSSILKEGNTYANIMIKSADIIYIPKEKIENFLKLVENVFTRGIYSTIPFTSTFYWGGYALKDRPLF